jgi:hypothetical protein
MAFSYNPIQQNQLGNTGFPKQNQNQLNGGTQAPPLGNPINGGTQAPPLGNPIQQNQLNGGTQAPQQGLPPQPPPPPPPPPQPQPPPPGSQINPIQPQQSGYGQHPQGLPPPPPQSVEQQALGGGSNPQQVSNFMKALQGVGAGSNNTFQNAPANNPVQQSAQPLYNNNATNGPQNNQTQGYYNPQTSAMQANGNPNPQLGQINPGNIVNGQAQNGSALPSIGAQVNNINQHTMNGDVFKTFDQGGANGGVRMPNQTLTSNQIANFGQGGTNGGVRMPNQTLNNQIQNPQSPINQSLVSDENAKTDIESGKKDLTSFLSNLGAHKYDYKDKEDGEAKGYVSPMAQELEKSKLGKTMVETRPDGKKQVNYGRGFGIITAAQSLLHDRLTQIEKSLKIKGK